MVYLLLILVLWHISIPSLTSCVKHCFIKIACIWRPSVSSHVSWYLCLRWKPHPVMSVICAKLTSCKTYMTSCKTYNTTWVGKIKRENLQGDRESYQSDKGWEAPVSEMSLKRVLAAKQILLTSLIFALVHKCSPFFSYVSICFLLILLFVK